MICSRECGWDAEGESLEQMVSSAEMERMIKAQEVSHASGAPEVYPENTMDGILQPTDSSETCGSPRARAKTGPRARLGPI
jgi:hypothetical protein